VSDRLPETAPSPACPRCGHRVEAGTSFCPGCGISVVDVQAGIATVSTPVAGATTGAGGGTWPGDDPTLELLRATTLGEYEVMGELGRGGMACVYLAHDIALDRKVAVKVMLPDVLRQEGMIERFKREAKTAANLGHPHIIPIFTVRESPGILFFVMKYVEGRPLDSVIREIGQLPLDMVRTVVSQVGDALDYAHRKGVIHRDVKPANIMIDTEGWALVADFGIAKVSEAHGLTVSGSVVGTPFYMSPEQAEGAELTGASDQYSLGIVAYQMLAGKLPFDNPSLMALLLAHREATPPPLQSLRPDCPAPMRVAVERMMAKKPEQRFPSVRDAIAMFTASARDDAGAVRTAMMTLARSNPTPVRRVSTPRSPAPALRRRPGAAPRAAPPARRRRRWLLPAGIAVIAAGGAAAVWLGVRGPPGGAGGPGEGEAPAAAPPPLAAPPADSLARAGRDTAPPESVALARRAATPARGRGAAPHRPQRPQQPQAAADTQPTVQNPPPPPAPSVGYVTIGTRGGPAAVVLLVNGENRGVLSGLTRVAVPTGRVRLLLRAAGCADWDTVLTLTDSSRIGYRRPSCPRDTL
jgi:predicted Ser/Thr protein kinase